MPRSRSTATSRRASRSGCRSQIVHNSVRPPSPSSDRRQGGARPAGGPRRHRLRRLRAPAEGLAGARLRGGDPRPGGRPGALRDHGRRRPSAGVLQDDRAAARSRSRTCSPTRSRRSRTSSPRRVSTTDFSFLPFTAETGEIYNALDIVTFPNQGVGLGRPVLEAATYGKPVVASGSETGAGVLLPGKTGLLLEDANPQELADALRLLIDDPELRRRLGEAAAEHARDPLRSRHERARRRARLRRATRPRARAQARAGRRGRRRMTLVSIVTPSLNQSSYLREAIESVRAQTHAAIEHIVVDGGSTDGTVEILREYPELRWVSEPDRGQSHALNKGFALASGDVLRLAQRGRRIPTRPPWPRLSLRSQNTGAALVYARRDARERRRRQPAPHQLAPDRSSSGRS